MKKILDERQNLEKYLTSCHKFVTSCHKFVTSWQKFSEVITSHYNLLSPVIISCQNLLQVFTAFNNLSQIITIIRSCHKKSCHKKVVTKKCCHKMLQLSQVFASHKSYKNIMGCLAFLFYNFPYTHPPSG